MYHAPQTSNKLQSAETTPTGAVLVCPVRRLVAGNSKYSVVFWCTLPLGGLDHQRGQQEKQTKLDVPPASKHHEIFYTGPKRGSTEKDNEQKERTSA